MTERARNLSAMVLSLEPLLLALILFAFWFPSPERDSWVWMLGLLIPVYGARYFTAKHWWTPTPLDDYFLAFTALCLISVFTAPYETRGLILLFRPLASMALFYWCVEYARSHRTIRPLITITIGAGMFLGILGITALDERSLSSIVDRLPAATAPFVEALPRLQNFPVWVGGFNPNELSGVLVWLAPLLLAVGMGRTAGKFRPRLALAAYVLIVFALLFGQSLSALMGLALGTAAVVVTNTLRRPLIAVVACAGILVQIVVTLYPARIESATAIFPQLTSSVSMQHRLELWQSASNILQDYPLTGSGIATYRSPAVRERYPTPGFSPWDAVHPHNELLQFGTDLGLPGMIVVAAWYAAAGYMLHQVERRSDSHEAKWYAVGLAAGLLAHLVYGLADAIPVWDRFGFVFFWMLGLAAAQYVLLRERTAQAEPSSTPDEAEGTSASAAEALSR